MKRGSEKDLLIEDLALELGCAVQTIRKNIVSNPGRVPPSYKLPGARRRRWRRADVEKFLADAAAMAGLEE